MAEKIRQYLINGKEIMPAYDIQEALLQYKIKWPYLAVTEIMPVTVVDESKPEKVEGKKEVHVKPNPAKPDPSKFGTSEDRIVSSATDFYNK